MQTIPSLLISVHSATLGKDKRDDTLIKIRNGNMTGNGEVALVFGKQVSAAILALYMISV